MSTAKRPGDDPGDGPAAKKKPKLPIVNDYESWAEAKAEAWASGKEDQHATLKAVGFPPDLGFESWKKKQHEEAGTFVKEKDLPDWCFLQTEPKRQLCISMDGKNVNTLFLVRKRRVLETETAFGKPLKMTILDSTKEKVRVFASRGRERRATNLPQGLTTTKAIALLAAAPPPKGSRRAARSSHCIDGVGNIVEMKQ